MYWNKLAILVMSILTWAACSNHSEDSYANHSVLIETKTWMDEHEQLEPFVYIDLRSPDLFDRGHLPGAINLTRNDIRNLDAEFSGMAIEAESMAELLGNRGISTEDWLILYDEKGGVEASRLWWLLRVYGHERVKILNGDLNLFDDEMELESTPKESRTFKFKGKPMLDWTVNYDEFEKIRSNPSTKVLDCRSAAEYDGEYIKPGAFLAGHIDGAENICYSSTIESESEGNLKIKSPKDLKKIYADFAQQDDTILVYCQSGVRSAHTLMVLREILNYKHVYNFDGSWIEWSYRNQGIPQDTIESNEEVI